MATAAVLSSTFISPRPTASNGGGYTRCSLPCKPLQITRRRPQRFPSSSRTGTAIRATQQTDQAEDSPPFSLLNLPTWAKWVLGSLAWLVIPAFQRLQKFGETLEKVDAVVEKIEEYAEKADKIAEEVGADLPEGKLKEMIRKVEKASEEVSAKAKLVDNVLDKVTDIVDETTAVASKKNGKSKARD